MVNVGYWLLLAGVVTMVADLTIAGLVEAGSWKSAAPWIESVRAAKPYWLVRALTFLPIGAGFLIVMIGLFAGNPGAGLREIAPGLPQEVQ
jgi:cbb3-type cytochrome oxidase subunit 1